MGLLDLPNELLLDIPQYLEYGWDLTAFGLVNRRLHNIINTYLYRTFLPVRSDEALYWAVENANESALACLLEAGVLENVHEYTAHEVLRSAISNGHDQILERLIGKGVTSIHPEEEEPVSGIEAWHRFYDTPLLSAVNAGHVTVVRTLLMHGIDDPNSGINVGLLSYAASCGNLAVMKYLMDEVGFEPNEPSYDGGTALEYAVRSGQTQAAELLLERGADPNLHSGDNGSPLMTAAQHCHLETVRLLLAHGSIVNPTPTQMKPPISSAFTKEPGDKAAIIRLIADCMNLDLLRIGHENRELLLNIASVLGKAELVQELLQQSGYPEDIWSGEEHQYDLVPLGPLEWAVEAAQVSVVSMILEFGVNGGGRKPLTIAIQKGHAQIAKVLLERNSGEYRRTSWFNGLLLSAFDEITCFELLLEYGADPTDVVDGEISLVEYVLMCGNLSLAQALVRHGYPLEFLFPTYWIRGASFLSYACRGGKKMREYIFQNGFDLDNIKNDEIQLVTREAIQREDGAVASFFLNRGYTIPRDHYLPDCIHLAAGLRNWDNPTETLLDVLLRSGVDINARDEDQQTCIWYAVTNLGHTQLKLLLERGADPLLLDSNGHSPLLHAATQYSGARCCVEYIQIIFEWIDLHWAELSREEIHQELSEAEAEAAKRTNSKIARILQRYRRIRFDSV
ncbi:ankyrin [Penicillium canariense]|uniref:Ankyrin n=1 Tax=Penicillium canariense TaxID=189055 RepID=A0A9W9HZU2_9EURO|nr:ankyrin [Penicillium canariense]KAJ5160512.1 ankyrin [Penicillium canariense]